MTAVPAPTPTQQAASRKAIWTALRLFGGLILLGVLAFLLWTPGSWAIKLFAWVLLTILADECAGWFGYAGLALGALVFFAPGTVPEAWYGVFPLISGALFALLLLKHSGGPFVLPFAGAIFAGAVLLANKLGATLGTPIKVLGNANFERMALVAMGLGLGFSFLRQLVSMLVRWQRRRAARKAAAVAAPVLTGIPEERLTERVVTAPAPVTDAAAPQPPIQHVPGQQTPGQQTVVTALPEVVRTNPDNSPAASAPPQPTPKTASSQAQHPPKKKKKSNR